MGLGTASATTDPDQLFSAGRFAAAEEYLARAVDLGDTASRQRLAECFVRQDQHARAVPLLRAGNQRDQAYAELYSRLEGPAWQVHGARACRS